MENKIKTISMLRIITVVLIHSFQSVHVHGIMDGIKVDSSSFPWLTRIESYSDTTTDACNGVLVSPEFVLSSAGCYANLDSKLLIGSSEESRVKEVFRHPEYNAKLRGNDLTLIRIQHVSNAEPAIIHTELDSYQDGDEIKIIGFDNTSKNFDKMVMKKSIYYSNSMFDTLCSFTYEMHRMHESAFCSYNSQTSAILCEDDIGSPVVDTNNNRVVFGLISGATCKYNNLPALVSRTASNWSWIKETICSHSDYTILPDFCYNTRHGEFLLKSGGSPLYSPLCMHPKYLGSGGEILLKPCDNNERKQIFTVDAYGQLHSAKKPTLCLSRSFGSKVALAFCDFDKSDESRNFIYDEFSSTIRLAKGGYWKTVTTQAYANPSDSIKLKFKPLNTALSNGSQNFDLLPSHERIIREDDLTISEWPSEAPTMSPSDVPSMVPSITPTSHRPSLTPTDYPSELPTFVPSSAPTQELAGFPYGPITAEWAFEVEYFNQYDFDAVKQGLYDFSHELAMNSYKCWDETICKNGEKITFPYYKRCRREAPSKFSFELLNKPPSLCDGYPDGENYCAVLFLGVRVWTVYEHNEEDKEFLKQKLYDMIAVAQQKNCFQAAIDHAGANSLIRV